MNSRRWSMLLVAAVSVAACGDDSTGPDTTPSFAVDITDVFERNGCSSSSCHGADGGRAGLELTGDAAADYAALVNAPARLESFDRVVPGNPDDSYLIIKVEGRQSVGLQMPIGLDPLGDDDLSTLRSWIDGGAPNN